MKVFPTAETQDAETYRAEQWRQQYGVAFESLDAAHLQQTEPNLDTVLLDGLRYAASDSVNDPSALVTAYAKYFGQLGGRFLSAMPTRFVVNGKSIRASV